MNFKFWWILPIVILIPLVISIFYFTSKNASVITSPASSRSLSPTAVPTVTPPTTAQIGLVGDLGLGRHITSTARAKNDFTWSFQGISSWLIENDLNIANLESPIIDNCPTGKTGTFTFCGDTRFLPQLSKHKFFFNLANNHILNYGQSGLVQTTDYLTLNSIPFVYSHSPEFSFTQTTINGITLGFVGYDFVTYPQYSQKQVLTTVEELNPQVDWLIVSLHWGAEYLPSPEKWRSQLAHSLVDAGADIIHGHHPHVWQPSEIYQNKPIYYSLGNFIFDQSWSYETSHTNIVRLTISKDAIVDTAIFPVEIRHNSQPWLDKN